jgi:hypothetical protein
LIVVLADAETEIGNNSSALRRLDQFEAAYGSSERLDVKRMHLRLALRVDSVDRAIKIVDDLGIETLPLDLLSNMASAALRAHRLDILSEIRQDVGGSFGLLDPLLRAQVHFAVGEISAARQLAEQVAELSAGDPAQMVILANLQLRMGQRDQALTSLRSFTAMDVEGAVPESDTSSILDGLASDVPRKDVEAAGTPSNTAVASQGSLPSALLRDIGALYIQAGAAHEGRQALERIRRRHPSPEADQAWAMAAIMSSHAPKVKAWLRETETSLTPDMLQELVYTATKAHAYALASDLAGLLVARRGTDADRLLLAEVRIAAGRPWVQVSGPDPAAYLKPNPVSLSDRYR